MTATRRSLANKKENSPWIPAMESVQAVNEDPELFPENQTTAS